jgi:hypothetical protein
MFIPETYPRCAYCSRRNEWGPRKHLTSANQAQNQQEYHSLASKTGDHEWILTTTTGDHVQLPVCGSYATWRKINIDALWGSVWQDVHSYLALCGGKVTRQPAKSEYWNKWPPPPLATPPPQKKFNCFWCFSFLLRITVMRAASPLPPRHEHTAVWLQDPFGFSKDFDALIYSCPSNIFSYLGANPRSMKQRKTRNGCIIIYPEQLPTAK